VLFSAFSAPPRETFQIKIPVSTGNYDRALKKPIFIHEMILAGILAKANNSQNHEMG
jgi:hypothetical protein